jgi:hypothetical protein
MCGFFDAKTRKAEYQVVATERDYLTKIFQSRNLALKLAWLSPALKASLSEMKPKENSDQRKSRLRREARAQKDPVPE